LEADGRYATRGTTVLMRGEERDGRAGARKNEFVSLWKHHRKGIRSARNSFYGKEEKGEKQDLGKSAPSLRVLG